MGARGPAPKPTQLKLLHGETRPSRVNLNEPSPRAELPEPPEWLVGEALRVWRYTLGELRHMRVVTAADRDALAVYCQAVAHYAEAAAAVSEQGMLITGKDGYTVRNPAMQFVRDQAVLVKAMAGQFGLTPSARVGLTAGEAPDATGAERLLS